MLLNKKIQVKLPWCWNLKMNCVYNLGILEYCYIFKCICACVKQRNKNAPNPPKNQTETPKYKRKFIFYVECLQSK